MKQIISRVLKADDTATHDVSVEDVLNAIRTGGKNLKRQVEKIRTEFQEELARSGDLKKAKLAVDRLKKRLPAVTFSGRFSRRDNRSLLTHSGLLCADLDSLGTRLPEVREKLESSPHVVAVFRSPTADGLKAVFRVQDDSALHRASYRAVEKHVLELTGVRIDESCKDVARLCFTSYDPQIWQSASARDIEPLPEVEKPRAVNNNGHVNLSVAVLFRVIEKFQPTFLADECDAWLRDNEELRGMLNAGHRRGGQALRCEGESNDVRAFNVFAPVVLCGIGALPGTLHDRSIPVRLERAKPGEIRKRYDPNRVEPETECCRKVARFCADNFAKIEACDPKLPDGVFNRLADNWRPLFAIADVAGGDWPQRMATALFELTDDDDVTAQGIGTRLLADIREIFAGEGVDRLHSETIATQLAAFEGKPWAEWARAGKPISKNQVAKQLKHFNIEPRDVRIGDAVLKGYLLEHFKEAFARYLPADPPFRSATALQKDEFTYENADI